ncbi:hypothetical protein GQ43DRAFT_468126 [Delitschia confertaspora ATCC 74209]|uniref:Uncharacterized protein n=1 Tax=Delitschia confertaspora ATCC 74209 TaxID=1513339 RepID=A0A9P4JVZ9_9PLEO|nr:hypothetical protein GQ43DRAFT_468126 [Delitschia confertaspora ATCC 74209]
MVATCTGHGMSLCKVFKEEENCTVEGLELHVLLVEYTEAALLLHGGSMHEAIALEMQDFDEAASFKLGSHTSLFAGSTVLRKCKKSVQDTKVQKATENPVKEDVGSPADVLNGLTEYIAAREALRNSHGG